MTLLAFIVPQVSILNVQCPHDAHSTLSHATKMNSLYQVRSKMLHGMKVIILVKKKEKKEVDWLGFELTTFILEVKRHHGSFIIHHYFLSFIKYK